MPDPRNGLLKGTLLDAVRFYPVGKTSREAANQERADAKASS